MLRGRDGAALALYRPIPDASADRRIAMASTARRKPRRIARFADRCTAST
jgi:hypothetical protein